MNSYLKIGVLMYTLSFTQAHTHDEISKCFLTGVHRTRQTIIESPNYPNNYKPDICWDYVIRSPYKCPTKFHIQFLEFDLEFSKDCKNDYLAIGLENIDDDMDVLCGQVVGIKKYHTPDGILRLRFFADESPWTTGKGFKLLITRLACEREELLRKLKDDDDDDVEDDDTLAVTAPSEFFQPPESELMQIFRNLTGQEQYQIVTLPPVFGLNYPTQLPSPLYPATGRFFVPSTGKQTPFSPYPVNDKQNNLQQPCENNNEPQRQLPYIQDYYGALKESQVVPFANSLAGSVQASYLPLNNLNSLQQSHYANSGFSLPSKDQYIGSWSNTPSLPRAYDSAIDSLEACCVSAFQQKRFYLSSPGFPRTIFSNILPNAQKRDCVFRLQKSSSSVCRLRLDLKFFDFGQSYQGTGSFMGNIGLPAIQNTQNVCQEDYIEIDNQRFCGCRSGFTFTAFWPTAADKKLRMRMGYSGIPSGGFLLELVQEECSETQLTFMTTERPVGSSLSSLRPNIINNQLVNPQQDLQQQQPQNLYGNSYPTQQHPQTQNINFASYQGNNPYNIPFGQQIVNTPAGFPTHFQQQGPYLTQHQQLQLLQNNKLYPSDFGSNYHNSHDLQQNILQPRRFATNPFGLPQTRYGRSYADLQPITVVETNSTRKEFYYTDSDGPNNTEPTPFSARSSSTENPSSWDRKDINIKENNNYIASSGRERMKCTFDMGDILRLSVDILWITKPICYSPQRNWFTNWIG